MTSKGGLVTCPSPRFDVLTARSLAGELDGRRAQNRGPECPDSGPDLDFGVSAGELAGECIDLR